VQAVLSKNSSALSAYSVVSLASIIKDIKKVAAFFLFQEAATRNNSANPF